MTGFLEISISENYPFFIWECEGNGVCYTIQILLKLFATHFNKTHGINNQYLIMFQIQKALKSLHTKVLRLFKILNALSENIFEKNFNQAILIHTI